MEQRQAKPIAQVLRELWDLLVAYARQETVDPLLDLGRYVGYGIGGAVLLAGGISLLALSTLRLLQTQTGDTFVGFWSWGPYLIVVVLLVLIVAAAIAAASRTPDRRA